LLQQQLLLKDLIFIVIKNILDMKKTLSIAVLSVFVWGCSHKLTPAAGGSGTGVSNSGAPAAVPSSVKSEGAGTAATPVTPATPVAKLPDDKTGSKTPADATSSASPAVMGQGIYNAKCGRCHGLKVTTDYTSDRWASIMQVMATKAQLNDTEKENVLAYVRANAKK
jgi:mono/diheme cytochrome c family protein